MEQFRYVDSQMLLSEEDLKNRDRLKRDYVKPGDIVVCQSMETNRFGASGHDTQPCAYIKEIQYGEKLWNMLFFKATPYEKLRYISSRLSYEFSMESMLSDNTFNLRIREKKQFDMVTYLVDIIEKVDVQYAKYEARLFALPFVVSDEYSPYMNRDVWTVCRNKIGAIGLNFNKDKTELYSILVAVSMIIGSGKSRTECERLTVLLWEKWPMFSMIYSLFYGRNISSKHLRLIDMLSFARNKREYEHYLKLFVIAIGDTGEKVQKIMRYAPNEIQNTLEDQMRRMQRQSELTEQYDDLDELFEILFPQTFKQHLANDNPYASIEEMQAELQESQLNKELSRNLRQYAHVLEKELGGSIKIEDLKAAFNHMDPKVAYEIFAKLDMELEYVNKVWAEHREEMKKSINLRFWNSQKQIEPPPTIPQIPSTVVNYNINGNVGSVIGNVENLTSKEKDTDDE